MIDLEKIVNSLKKRYLGTMVGSIDLSDFVSTGNLALDLILDGGIPFGVGTEFVGFSASGKSLLLQMIIANAQSEYDAVGVLIDRETSFTAKRASELKIDLSKIVRCSAFDVPYIADAFEFIIESIQSIRKQNKDQYIVIGIDSISAFDKESDELDKADMGKKQKSLHEGFRRLIPLIDSKVMMIICNQFYYKPGVSYGSPIRAGGGEGLRYYNTVRMALDEKKKIIDPSRGDEVIGSWLGAEVIKTRFGPCYRTCQFPFYYKTGIDYYGGYARLLVDRGYLKPKNKTTFDSFKSHTLIFGDGKIVEKVNEFEIEKFLSTHGNLLFEKYPDYNETAIRQQFEEEDE